MSVDSNSHEDLFVTVSVTEKICSLTNKKLKGIYKLSKEKNQDLEANLFIMQLLELSDRECQIAIINILGALAL